MKLLVWFDMIYGYHFTMFSKCLICLCISIFLLLPSSVLKFFSVLFRFLKLYSECFSGCSRDYSILVNHNLQINASVIPVKSRVFVPI